MKACRTSSEKQPNMFGTLVFCLPSKHTGGEVHVKHGDREKIFRSAESSEYDYMYLCWFVPFPTLLLIMT